MLIAKNDIHSAVVVVNYLNGIHELTCSRKHTRKSDSRSRVHLYFVLDHHQPTKDFLFFYYTKRIVILGENKLIKNINIRISS
jgi:hypothetical protein